MGALDRVLAGWCERWRAASAERGQTLAEYSLIITIIAVAVVVLSMVVFRNALVGAYNTATTCLDGAC